MLMVFIFHHISLTKRWLKELGIMAIGPGRVDRTIKIKIDKINSKMIRYFDLENYQKIKEVRKK